MKVMQDMKDHVSKCRYMFQNVSSMETMMKSVYDETDGRQCPVCKQDITKAHKKVIDAQCYTIFLKDETVHWDKAILKSIEKTLGRLLNILSAIAQPMADIDRVQDELEFARADVVKRESNLTELKSKKKSSEVAAKEALERNKDLEKVVLRLREIQSAWQNKSSLLQEKARELENAMGLMVTGGKSVDDLEALQAQRLQDREQAQKNKDALAEKEKAIDQMSFALQNAATDAENTLLSLTQQCTKIKKSYR